MRLCGALPVLLALCSCGRDSRVEFVERCGVAEPVQLLALGDDEMVPWTARGVVDAGDRVLVGLQDRVDISTFTAGLDRVGAARRVVSVDACGGDERLVASGVDTILLAPRSDAPSFACAGGEAGLVWIDPAGLLPPRGMGAVGCTVAWVDDRAVFERWVSEEQSELVVATFGPSGEIESVEVLAAPLGSWERQSLSAEQTASGDEVTGHVFALTAGRLLDIDVRTGDTRVVAYDVVRFGSRYPVVVYFSPSTAVLVDLETGTRLELASSFATFGHGPVFGPDTVSVFDNGGWGETGIVTLEDNEFHVRSDRWTAVATMSDRTRIVTGARNGNRAGLHRWAPGETVEYMEGMPSEAWQDGELWFLTYVSGEHERSQELVVFDDPTLQRRVVLHEVYRPQRLSQDRWLTVRANLGDVAGELVVVRPGTDVLQPVDEDVHLEFSAFAGGPKAGPGDGTVTYVVESGLRRGLWRARIAD